MKRSITLFFVMCVTMLANAQSFNIASYNLRNDNPGDAASNPWTKRFPHIAAIITKEDFDVFGTQEGLYHQLTDLLRILPAYDYVGLGRKGGHEGEHSAIFYKRDKFTLLQSGNFWLSETPDKVSVGWDAKYERICSWAKFAEKETGFVFYFFNTHFDHKGNNARKQSVSLIFSKISAIAGTNPAILSGDFNVNQKDVVFEEFAKFPLFKNGYTIASDLRNANTNSFNGFDTSLHNDERIDHLFLSPAFKVNTYHMVMDKYDGGKFPSDHFPIIIQVSKNENARQEITATIATAGLYPSFPESFEGAPEKVKYDRQSLTLKTGEWILDNAVIQNTANDIPSSGTYAVRFIKDNTAPAYLQMDFDLPKGASKVTVAYSSYSAKADPLCMWALEYSIDRGKTWHQTGQEIVAENKRSKELATFNMSIKGQVRFRINKLGLGNSAANPDVKNGRLSIDDFAVYQN
jgi:endonuclease/exonuclease/phosphatase family metal-dependent hydrolase